MKKLPHNVLLNFRLEFPNSNLTIYLPSGISDIFCQMVSTPGPCCSADKSILFWLRHVKLYYHTNQIWHVCNNLLDAMVQVPYGNCFSWLKKNSQTLREERTLQQPMVNNETIMLSERATLLRDIRFGIRFLVKNVVSFSFTLFFFISFLLQARKRRKQLALSAV